MELRPWMRRWLMSLCRYPICPLGPAALLLISPSVEAVADSKDVCQKDESGNCIGDGSADNSRSAQSQTNTFLIVGGIVCLQVFIMYILRCTGLLELTKRRTHPHGKATREDRLRRGNVHMPHMGHDAEP